MQNNIACSTNCKYKKAATLCTLKTWFVSVYSILTHLCLTFHYWNGSDVVVIYILLRKVIAESDFSPMSASRQGICYLVVHRVGHCCRYWRVGNLSKSDENFSEIFFYNHPTTGKYNFTALHPILVIFFYYFSTSYAIVQ